MTDIQKVLVVKAQDLIGEQSDARTTDILISRALGASLQSLGDKYRVSRERIRQLEKFGLWRVSDTALLALRELSGTLPPNRSERKAAKASNRKIIKAYAALHPEETLDYQILHAVCGVPPPTDELLFGNDSLVRLHADYGICDAMELHRCRECKSFRPKDEFCHMWQNKPVTMSWMCRACNTKRHEVWYYMHRDHAIEYAKKRNKLPAAKVYRERWQAKKLLEDPEYFRRSRRERVANMTDEQRDKLRKNWREYSKKKAAKSLDQ